MENPKRLIPLRGRAALVATACLITPLFAGEPAKSSGTLAERELAKRSAAVQEARELLVKGDESYQAGRYSDAVQAYEGARGMIPETPNTAEIRNAVTERYIQASVQYGRELSRKGDVAGAKAVIDKVLLPGVAPADPAAISFRAELDDPIRTNPALDTAHAKNVDEVRRLLYTAEGAYNLGKYDQAKAEYENVLRIDRFNTAARRGLERLAAARSAYYKSSYDQARAEMLSEVDAAFELPLSPSALGPDLPPTGVLESAPSFIPVSNKLKRIIIPKVQLEQASLSEAIEFLRAAVLKNDSGELGGVNFTIELGDSARTAAIDALRFDLQLTSTPLAQVLKYITDATRTSFTTDDYSVIIRPLGAGDGQLITRTYKVPPDFITSISSGAGSAAPVDPFAAAPAAGGGLLAKRLGAQEALAQQGVAFPPGALAIFNPATNTLSVTNTAPNQDIIDQIIESTIQSEPVLVAVRVTMIKTEQRNLEELGFDWLLDPVGLDRSNKVNLSGGSRGNGGNLGDMLDPTSGNSVIPITAGNRSGQEAISGDSIDDLIASGSDRTPQNSERAPGVLKLTRLISGQTVTAMMRGLSQKKGVDLMTQPTTITRSGQASSIHVVREFIYPTSYEPPKLPQTISSTELYLNGVYIGSLGGNSFPVTPATPTDFKKRDVGVILEVLPTADANKQFVDVTLNPTITDFDGFVNYGSPISMPGSNGNTTVITPNEILAPVFNVKRLNTSITVQDGATIVIGGLLKESIQDVEDKTPILGDLPVVGRLFQSKARQPVSTAIIFLVNVQLVDPSGRPFHNH